jgi:prophage regulatory protein
MTPKSARETENKTNTEDDVNTTAETSAGLPDDDLLPMAEVKKIAGLSRAMIYRLERAGRFPKRYKPGGHASRWSRREVMDWRESQREARS